MIIFRRDDREMDTSSAGLENRTNQQTLTGTPGYTILHILSSSLFITLFFLLIYY